MRNNRTLMIVVALLVAILLVPTCFFVVNEAEVGIVSRFGKPRTELAEPGLHFKLPWPIDSVLRVDRRLLIFDNEPAEMLTRDKRNVLIDSFILWRVADPLKFVQTMRNRAEAEARLLDLTASELGAAVGNEPMASLINIDPTQVKIRDIATRAAEAVQATTLEGFGIDVVDLRINGLNLPPQNRASVINRMTAERGRIATAYRSEGEEEALKIEAEANKEQEAVMAEAEAQAVAIRGQGEAEALSLLAEAYAADPEFYRFLRDLESYETILDRNTTIFIESDSKLLETLNGDN